MPPKGASKKSPTPSAHDSSWLFEFSRAKEIPEDVIDVLAQNHIISKSISTAISENDLANISFVVGQKILLRLVIFRLQQDNEDPLPTKPIPSEASGLLPAIDLQQKLSNIEATFSISSPSKDNRELKNHDEVHKDDVCWLGKEWNENVCFGGKKKT